MQRNLSITDTFGSTSNAAFYLMLRVHGSQRHIHVYTTYYNHLKYNTCIVVYITWDLSYKWSSG